MKFLSEQDFFETLGNHGVVRDSLETHILPDGSSDKISFPVPAKHSQIMHFSRTLMRMSSPKSGLLLLPTEWGIWPSSENLHLYYSLRKYQGEGSSLREAPCHSFSPDELDAALDFIYLFSLFSWGFYLFSFWQADIAFVSHDEYVTYYSPARIEEIREIVESELADLFDENGDRAESVQ